ncbi:hypothetical protein B7494_g5307 [Chlorociboria aeruginascens]|nr:hypothetical protein B7494_g5307 [Chlorociboria aeruginascens]
MCGPPVVQRLENGVEMPTLIQRSNTDRSTSSRGLRQSDESQDSQYTAPTSYNSSPRPSIQASMADRPVYYGNSNYNISPATTYYPRSSAETYASTIADQEDLCEEPESYDPDYEVLEYKEVVETNLRPSNPQDFASFFPSTNRLYIRHDDTSFDGNMNLRVDTEAGSGRRKTNVQLFHMRMHDLKRREFSLRRYERSSGREVCHSSRKYSTKPASDGRPGITRSMSNALANIVKRPEFKRTNSGNSFVSFKKHDSGYGSENEEDDIDSFMSDKKSKSPSVSVPTNTTKLEFSNYAQVDVTRRGAKSTKKYEFEYWGHTYSWKRVIEKDGQGQAISYHLFKGDSSSAVAHIVPELRSPAQMRAEDAAGGWVPPCSMWISDRSVLEAVTDVADIIIATGLIALIDDCIKRHFHTKSTRTRQVGLPLTPLKVDMDFVGPKAMVEHMFKRRNSGGSTKDSKEQRGSPLKYTSPIEAY